MSVPGLVLCSYSSSFNISKGNKQKQRKRESTSQIWGGIYNICTYIFHLHVCVYISTGFIPSSRLIGRVTRIFLASQHNFLTLDQSIYIHPGGRDIMDFLSTSNDERFPCITKDSPECPMANMFITPENIIVFLHDIHPLIFQ